MRIAPAILMVTLILSVGVLTYAQKDADDPARIAFQQGVDHFKAGRYEEAVKSFREANRISPAWKLLYNIGQSEAAAKRYGLALEAFEEDLAKGGDEVPKDREQEVLTEVERLRKMVSTVEIKGKNGDKVVVNGIDRGALPTASRLKVEMGMMKVQVQRKGQTILEQEIKLSGGETISLEVPQEEQKAVATQQPAEAPSEPVVSQDKPKRVWTWVAFSVGGAAAIGAAITGGVASSKASSLDENCPDKLCPDSEKGNYDSTKSLAVTTDVLIGFAVAGAVTGTVLFFLEPKIGSSDETIALKPMTSLQGAGLLVEGKF